MKTAEYFRSLGYRFLAISENGGKKVLSGIVRKNGAKYHMYFDYTNGQYLFERIYR